MNVAMGIDSRVVDRSVSQSFASKIVSQIVSRFENSNERDAFQSDGQFAERGRRDIPASTVCRSDY